MSRLAWIMPAAVALIAAAPPPAVSPTRTLAGAYDGSQMEMAAILYLYEDGRFEFAVTYGALDESADGTWVREGDSVKLNVLRFRTNDPSSPPFGLSTLHVDGEALTLPRHERMLRFTRRD